MDSSNQSGGHSPFTVIKTEPLGTTVLLRNEEVPEYRALAESVKQQFQPETMMEKLLAEWIISHQWRLRRMARLEEGLFSIGRSRLGARYTCDEDLRVSKEQIDSNSKTTYEKQFNYMAKQARFLQQRLKRDTKELTELVKKNPRRSKNNGLFLVPKRERVNP